MLGTLFESQRERTLARVAAVCATGFLPYPPSDLQRGILRVLQMHVGRDRAIGVDVLAAQLKISPREVKSLVRELRLQPFRVPVGSSRAQLDGGYFLCATPEERVETARQYSRQALSELKVVRDLLEPHELAEELGQITLQLQEGVDG